MKNFPFLQELTEARLFQKPTDLKNKSADDLAQIVYVMVMALEVSRYINPSFAAHYAEDTMRYSPYENMHYAGTDLANLLAVLNFQNTFKDNIKVNKSISVPMFQINRYLSSVRSGSIRSHNEDCQFFYRLEDYLKAYSSGVMRQLRRDVGDWENLNRASKIQIDNLLRREMNSSSSSADIFQWYRANFRIKESIGESIDTKLSYHNELNPALWDGTELRLDVKKALSKIANRFSDFVDVHEIQIVDYIITGSNCAYNYTSQSDIDLHVLVDASMLDDTPLLDPFLRAKKSLWNSEHDITVKGFDVELYAEDLNNPDSKLVATGIYSLLQDKWIKEPQHTNVQTDDNAVSAKAESIMHHIDSIIRDNDATPAEIAKIWDHLKKMRKSGLESGGEFSVENLAYKAVRNNGYFDLLSDYESNMENDELTLEHQHD